TKYHMNVPLYTTTFVWIINKSTYEGMSPTQRKAIDEHCTTDWALRVASPWADFERAGVEKLTNEAGHEVYTISDAQLAEWKLAAQPVVQAWSESVRKVGGDPDAMLKEFRDTLPKYTAHDRKGGRAGAPAPAVLASATRHAAAQAYRGKRATQLHGPLHRYHRMGGGVFRRHRGGKHLRCRTVAQSVRRIAARCL